MNFITLHSADGKQLQVTESQAMRIDEYQSALASAKMMKQRYPDVEYKSRLLPIVRLAAEKVLTSKVNPLPITTLDTHWI